MADISTFFLKFGQTLRILLAWDKTLHLMFFTLISSFQNILRVHFEMYDLWTVLLGTNLTTPILMHAPIDRSLILAQSSLKKMASSKF